MISFPQIPPTDKLYDDYRHRPLIVTNEEGQNKTIKVLSENPTVGNTMMGVGGFFILNAVAARGSRAITSRSIERIILIDRGIRVEHFWHETSKLIKSSTNRVEVLQGLEQLLQKEAGRYFEQWGDRNPQNMAVTAEAEFSALQREINEISWLSDDSKFIKIKRIFDQNHFIFIRVNLFDSASMKTVAEALHQDGCTLDSIYLSNVSEYCANELEKINYLNGVSKILGFETYVIHAHSQVMPWGEEFVEQAIHQKGLTPLEEFLFPVKTDATSVSTSSSSWKNERITQLAVVCVMLATVVFYALD